MLDISAQILPRCISKMKKERKQTNKKKAKITTFNKYAGLEPTIYRTRGSHAIHYAMNAVFDVIFALTFYRSILLEMDLPHMHANIVIYRKKISKIADGSFRYMDLRCIFNN